VWPGDQSGEPPDPGRELIEGRKIRPLKQRCFGTGTARRDRLNGDAETVEAFLQIENDLACLCPKQMLARALGAAFDAADGEHVDMARGDLKHVPAVIEKLWVTAIEYDSTNGVNVARSIGRRLDQLEKGLVHS
jgi:hypothetical protein